MSDLQRTAVVTGVSTGIGWGVLKVLVANGFHVFGSVRKQEDAARLQDEFGDAFTPLIFDVTDEPAVHDAAAIVESRLKGQTLTGLVNNAGIAVGGPLLHLPIDEYRQQLEVNLTGVLISTQAFAPLLGAGKTLEGKPGRIANMGSIGGRNAYPFMAPYHVTKYGLEGFNESLRRELMVYGVDVAMIAPASIATPIWSKAEQYDFSRYKDTDYGGLLDRFVEQMVKIGAGGLPPERVGEAVLHALTADKPKVRYVISGRPWEVFLTEKLPRRWVDNIVASRLGIKD